MKWTTFACSVAGKYKIKFDKENQDAAVAWVSGRNAYGSIGDGLGSCKRSARGAASVVGVATQELPKLFGGAEISTTQDVKQRFHILLDSIRSDIAEKAKRDDCSIEDYHTTLLAIAIGDDWFAAASIGDGFLAARYAGDENYFLALSPAKSRYVGETATVLIDDAHDHLQVFFSNKKVERAFGSSDGLASHCLIFENGGWSPHQPFFRNLLEAKLSPPATELEARNFLNHPQINSDKADDDKSLIGFFSTEPESRNDG